MTPNSAAVEIPDHDSRFAGDDGWGNYRGAGRGFSEIEEVCEGNDDRTTEPLGSIREEAEGFSASLDFSVGEEAVYVAVEKQSEETSTDALVWTLNNALNSSSTVVYLIHVFPETKHIPTPLGKLPISQVNPEQKENYLAQERGKRRVFLQKFLNICAPYQVQVDTILIESDMETKAILDLIPILNIRKLVLGTTKSNLRKMRSKKGNGIADQILQNAPEFCEVKIVCEGKEMSELPLESPSPSPSPRATDAASNFGPDRQTSVKDTFACGCFSMK